MHRVGICGHFGEGKDFYDGQTVKTKTLTEELQNLFGTDEVTYMDTYNWKGNPFALLLRCISIFKNSKSVIMLPAQNGLKIFIPLFIILNRIFKRRIYYVVIGGWLPDYLDNQRKYLNGLKNFDCIFVETLSMSNKLQKLGLNNVSVMPNFKKISILSKSELSMVSEKPFKLCTFSRVLKEKGIEDAINAVIKINSSAGREVYVLDIYGQIAPDYEDTFHEIMTASPDYINYKGVIPYNKVVDILKDYYLMLFPTYYIGEGFAGTILDAFASGLPVVASDWRYNSELIQDGKTGRIIPCKNVEKLAETLLYYMENQEEIKYMREKCIDEAYKYTPENAIEYLYKCLND
ncbi:glycosyltransferase family 4 protein [Cytobacillus sp. FSL K6-0265]|uniref:glycosyltransferase family 4 protein n=1 Tax=Cytobacillus sp. FSL K6-0265 TaxID=2921448 RepID=UPI0030FBF928